MHEISEKENIFMHEKTANVLVGGETMGTKKTMEVLIDRKLYTLATEDSGEHVQRIINYFNGKIDEFKKNSSFKRMTKDYQNVLISLNIADDLFKEREKVANLKEEIAQREREIEKLKEQLDEIKLKQSLAKQMLGETKKEIKQRHEKQERSKQEKNK